MAAAELGCTCTQHVRARCHCELQSEPVRESRTVQSLLDKCTVAPTTPSAHGPLSARRAAADTPSYQWRARHPRCHQP